MRRLTIVLLLMGAACSSSSTAPTAKPPVLSLPGSWTLQAVASDSCSGLPADAKNRTYTIVTIYQTGYDTISINVGVTGKVVTVMNASYSGLKIQDRLRLDDISGTGSFVIDGTFTGSVSQNRIAGTLNGNISSAAAECAAADHRLTFTR